MVFRRMVLTLFFITLLMLVLGIFGPSHKIRMLADLTGILACLCWYVTIVRGSDVIDAQRSPDGSWGLGWWVEREEDFGTYHHVIVVGPHQSRWRTSY